jgi:glutamine amidotransferase
VIALVDYGAGNLTSVRKALSTLGASVWTPAQPDELARADSLIVPGVGHFDATRGLTDEWRAAIRSSIEGGKPVLGICVGLQWLFDGSTEAPGVCGLGVFRGLCARLPESSVERFANSDPSVVRQAHHRPEQGRGAAGSGSSRAESMDEERTVNRKVPHVGWNSLTMPKPSRLMEGVAPNAQVYFTHSYAAPVIDDTAAICEYGVPFSAAVERGHVAAVQFHPEKSGDAGLRILRNWLDARGAGRSGAEPR